MNAGARYRILPSTFLVSRDAYRRTRPRGYVQASSRRSSDCLCLCCGCAGFKSYPVRTQITGWDPSFNAITGLNGSGMSMHPCEPAATDITSDRQIEHSGRDLLRPRSHKSDCGSFCTARMHQPHLVHSSALLLQVRATSQQDLIYKRGQAGVTKASVTVVFDNSDRATSPVGFENFAQITVTRQVALLCPFSDLN